MLKIPNTIKDEQLLKASYGNFKVKRKYDEDTGEVVKIYFMDLNELFWIAYYYINFDGNGFLMRDYDSNNTDLLEDLYNDLIFDLIQAGLVEKIGE